MTATLPTVAIESGATTSRAEIDRVLEMIRADHPGVTSTVNPDPDKMLEAAGRR